MLYLSCLQLSFFQLEPTLHYPTLFFSRSAPFYQNYELCYVGVYFIGILEPFSDRNLPSAIMSLLCKS